MLLMKRIVSWMLLGGLLLMFVSGCTVIREVPMEQALPEQAAPELQLCRVLLEAFLKNDARAFVDHLPADTRNDFDVKKFDDTREYITKTLGTPVTYQYVTTLKFVTLSPHIWKIGFERKDRKGEIIRSEALFRIITGQTGPEKKDVSVIGFNFL